MAHLAAGWALLRSGRSALTASCSRLCDTVSRQAADLPACSTAWMLPLRGGPNSHVWHRAYSDALVPHTQRENAPTTTAAEATAVAATQPPATPGGRLRLPRWLRNILPGGKELAASGGEGREVEPEQGSKEKSASGPAGGEEDDIKHLEELRNLTMEGYVEYCKKVRGGSDPPRPRQPPMPRDHHDYKLWRDFRRITYLRLLQHERIGSLISKEENDAILARKEEVLKDQALLEAIADRTGVYIDHEVKDCIRLFLDTRKRGERMHRYVTEFGQPLPKNDDDERRATSYMDRVEAEEKLRDALAKRDVANCPLRYKMAWAGPAALCELTGLRYWECCGKVTGSVKSEAELPVQLQHDRRKKEEDERLDRVHVRRTQQAFHERAARRLRKAALQAGKPRFRDY